MPAITVAQLHELLTNEMIRGRGANPLMIAIRYPHPTIGGTPKVPVASAAGGFDWDQGKFMLYPERDLTPLKTTDADALEQLRIEADYKRQERERIADLLETHYAVSTLWNPRLQPTELRAALEPKP